MIKDKLKSYFITGLFTLLPLFVTIVILVKVYNLLFNILNIFPKFDFPFNLGILINLVIFLGVIMMLGLLMKLYFTKEFYSYFEEKLMSKIPVINIIYNSTKQLISIFTEKKSNSKLLKAVYVEYPKKGTYSLGFITKLSEKVGNLDMTAVLIPTSPTPFSGMLVYAKKSEIIDADVSTKEAIKIITSSGMVGRDKD